ncbi:hypothetical protein ACP3V5_17075 [Vibrio maritimus]
MAKQQDFMAVGRAALGETAVHIVSAMSFSDAALIAAKLILSEQHSSWNDNIYIDVVTDKAFSHETDFVFEIQQLR